MCALWSESRRKSDGNTVPAAAANRKSENQKIPSSRVTVKINTHPAEMINTAKLFHVRNIDMRTATTLPAVRPSMNTAFINEIL